MSAFSDGLHAALSAGKAVQKAGEHVLEADVEAIKGVPKTHLTNTAREQRIVTAAALKYDINPALLWGVYGMETAYGSDVKDSSAGAVGPFQFLPSTAASVGYPTNINRNGVTSLSGFKAQAEAAARYLASLLPGGKGESGLSGSAWTSAWNSALEHYSGGGYGLTQVRAKGHLNATEYGHETEVDRTYAAEQESSGGVLAQIETWLEQFALDGVLLLAGAALAVYGVMVAVGPREREKRVRSFAIPVPA